MCIAMHILDLIAERKSKQAYYASRKSAEDYFFKQKSSIQAIRDTAGFKEIQDYWVRVAEASFERLKTVKSDDIKAEQAILKEADQFCQFLDNLANAPK